MLMLFSGKHLNLVYFYYFCLTNDYSIHMKFLLLDKLVFLDTEE